MCNLESKRKVASENSVGKFEFYLQAATPFCHFMNRQYDRYNDNQNASIHIPKSLYSVHTFVYVHIFIHFYYFSFFRYIEIFLQSINNGSWLRDLAENVTNS